MNIFHLKYRGDHLNIKKEYKITNTQNKAQKSYGKRKVKIGMKDRKPKEKKAKQKITERLAEIP